MLKNLTASAVDADVGLIPGSERFSWRRKWLPTPVFLPGKFHGQRGLAEYSPWGRTELDATDVILVPGAFVSTPSLGDLCAPETCLSWTGPGLCGQGRPGRGGDRGSRIGADASPSACLVFTAGLIWYSRK